VGGPAGGVQASTQNALLHGRAALGVLVKTRLLHIYAAERVKVFVRIRPTKAEGETGGAVRAKTGSKGLVIFRE
jgi:hypothetical protein